MSAPVGRGDDMILNRFWPFAICAIFGAILGLILTPAAASAAAYRMLIQAHADVGGKCLDVPYAQFVYGMRLQMWNCNNGTGQIFAYDDQTQELKIGDLCVTSWGHGDPQDAVGIGPCHNGANQHWRMVAVKDYYQVVGMNNRCLELRYGYQDLGAALDVQDCDPGRTWRLWALVEAPPGAAESAGCHTDDYAYGVIYSQSATANSVSTGGGACIYTPHPGFQVEWTSLTITERPQNGTFEQTAAFEFKYQPKPGFKGQDEAAVKACGHNADRSGCATITYRITVN